MTIRTGPRQGELAAKVSNDRKAKLGRLGRERALIYKTLVLTGLRANELRTLTVADVSFGDVPFIKLRHSNEKSRKGSSVALRSDLAAELRAWTEGRERTDRVFNVPAGILRILNRDLAAAGIDKTDADGCIVHVHALRHSFGTHLSRAGVAPRVAQAAMRHSDIGLTMGVYTDARLLDTAEAVERLHLLSESVNAPADANTNETPDERPEHGPRMVAPTVAPNEAERGHIESISDHSEPAGGKGQDTKKPCKTLGFTGFSDVGATRVVPWCTSPMGQVCC